MSNIANAHNGKALLEVSERLTALKNSSSGRRGFIKAAQIEQKCIVRVFRKLLEVVYTGISSSLKKGGFPQVLRTRGEGGLFKIR